MKDMGSGKRGVQLAGRNAPVLCSTADERREVNADKGGLLDRRSLEHYVDEMVV